MNVNLDSVKSNTALVSVSVIDNLSFDDWAVGATPHDGAAVQGIGVNSYWAHGLKPQLL